jgi:hypothetical protein
LAATAAAVVMVVQCLRFLIGPNARVAALPIAALVQRGQGVGMRGWGWERRRLGRAGCAIAMSGWAPVVVAAAALAVVKPWCVLSLRLCLCAVCVVRVCAMRVCACACVRACVRDS